MQHPRIDWTLNAPKISSWSQPETPAQPISKTRMLWKSSNERQIMRCLDNSRRDSHTLFLILLHIIQWWVFLCLCLQNSMEWRIGEAAHKCTKSCVLFYLDEIETEREKGHNWGSGNFDSKSPTRTLNEYFTSFTIRALALTLLETAEVSEKGWLRGGWDKIVISRSQCCQFFLRNRVIILSEGA